jgi:hypothetical protein
MGECSPATPSVDSLDWELLLKAVRRHTDCPWVLLYIERWLKAPVQMEDGGVVPRMIHVGIFVEHDAVEIEAAQGVRIIRAVKPDLAAVGIVGAQLGFIHRGPGLAQERHGIAQVIPRHGLGLFEERREIGKPRVLPRGFDRTALELMNAGNRLASPAMGDDAGEALLAPMKRAELRSRAIIEILASHSCLQWSGEDGVCVPDAVQHDAPLALMQPARAVSARRGAPLIRDLRRLCVLLW